MLTGAGRAFCAGGDVKRMAEETVGTATPTKTRGLRAKMEISRLLHEIPKPTIAMVNGAAAGAGMAMALACDLRIAGQSARFVTAFAKVGFSGDFGGSYFLSNWSEPARRASSISPRSRSTRRKRFRSAWSTGSYPMPSSPPSRWT